MGPTTRETVLKTNVNDINLVKLLIPKILIGSKQYLLADIEDDLTYLKIKEFYRRKTALEEKHNYCNTYFLATKHL